MNVFHAIPACGFAIAFLGLAKLLYSHLKHFELLDIFWWTQLALFGLFTGVCESRFLWTLSVLSETSSEDSIKTYILRISRSTGDLIPITRATARWSNGRIYYSHPALD